MPIFRAVCLLFVALPPGFAARWTQSYDPAGHWQLSALLAALPLLLLLALMLGLRMKAHRASLITLVVALGVAVGGFHMPVKLAGLATGYGVLYGLFPIFWIVFPVIFMYELTVRAGRFALLQQCLTGVTEDARLQLVLIAFALGAFFEGAAGFGTPLAVCGTLLVGIGFVPLEAAVFALIANTAPVAFGGLGTPVVALHGVTGIDTLLLSRAISMLLAPFCVILPFWVVGAFAGFSGMLEVWPALLLAGTLFGAVQLGVATLQGPWLVNIVASLVTIAALVALFRVWKPKRIVNARLIDITGDRTLLCRPTRTAVGRAMMPWAILTLCVGLWGTPAFAHMLDSVGYVSIAIPGLHGVVARMPPVVPVARVEPAVFVLNWLSATGTGIFVAALIAAWGMGVGWPVVLGTLWTALWKTRYTMVTIATLMGLGFLTRFCGLDGVLGLAFARTGNLYPFFGTLIGWIGTASTGSDTSSNVLFGSLQKLTAEQLGIAPLLMAAANSGGGVMGKMIAPQSLVVASTTTGVYGSEGSILRQVVVHSMVLACLMGLLVLGVLHAPRLLRLLGG